MVFNTALKLSQLWADVNALALSKNTPHFTTGTKLTSCPWGQK